MTKFINNLKNEIETFFNKATDEEIQIALDRANYSFYKTVDTPIIKMNQQKEFFISKGFK